MSKDYTDIEHLTQREHIRKRTAMYSGSTESDEYNSALYNLFREIYHNSIDEALNGYATLIKVNLSESLNQIKVTDNGRGIPHSFNEEHQITNLELAVGVPNSGGKFSKGKGQHTNYAAGLNGLGSKLTNFLSEYFSVTSTRDNQTKFISYKRGLKESEKEIPLLPFTGTTTVWIVDKEILPFEYKEEILIRIIEETSFLNPNVKIIFNSEKTTNREFYQPKGISSYLTKILGTQIELFKFPIFSGKEDGHFEYEIASAILSTNNEKYLPFVNSLKIEEASTPVVAFRKAFAKALMNYIDDHVNLPKRYKDKSNKKIIKTSDIRAGLVAVIKILHVNAAFDSQTKTKLVSTDISKFISDTLPDKIQEALLSHPQHTARIIAQIMLQTDARLAAEKAKSNILSSHKKTPIMDLNISLDIFTPPLEHNPQKNSLYLFEGISAAGSLIKASKHFIEDTKEQYKKYIGILALRGMALNTLETTMERLLRNKEFSTLIEVAGLNPKNPDDLTGLNFNKFIIASDEDAGGRHIAILLTTFFLRHFPKIIEQGYLYKINTPLFEIKNTKKNKTYFIYADENKQELLQQTGYKEDSKIWTLKRNKGLGEMSDAANLTLVRNPRLQQFKSENIKELLEMFHLFSGKANVQDRRDLIFEQGLTSDKE